MFELTKTPMLRTLMDSDNVSALMCERLFDWALPSSTLPNGSHLSSYKKYWANYRKIYHWTSVDACGFNTMAHHSIMQVRFVIILTDVSAEMDRPRRSDCMTSTIAGFNPTRFFLWVHIKSFVYPIPVDTWKIYLHKFWTLHMR